jgi:DNA-binding XRE family transcriptional regulator
LGNNRIRQKLQELGKTVGWLARRTGMDSAKICHLMDGTIPNPTIKTCIRLARGLHCKVDDLWPTEE